MQISYIADSKAKKIREIVETAIDHILQAQKECETFEAHFSYEDLGTLSVTLESSLQVAINELEEIKKIKYRSCYCEFEESYHAVC